jgi:phosphatidylglycerophosphate synthase
MKKRVPRLEDLCIQQERPTLTLPKERFCEISGTLNACECERKILASIGKDSELLHVKWIRALTYPGVRRLAERQVSPNLITWIGFFIGLLGAAVIATGTYWNGVIGSMLLCGSWILDNVDGTLARLTFSESPLGEKLDTRLGHLTNIAFFIALVFAVYGRESLWTAAIFCVFMVGSITLAYHICKAERRHRHKHAMDREEKRLSIFLAQINGRDFTILIFLFAGFDGFKFFLWGSLWGLQVFWILHVWLMIHGAMGSGYASTR